MSTMRPRAAIDTTAVREQNSHLTLELVWRERQISRAEISRRTGLSPSTVSLIVTELEQSKLVRELGAGTSRGGRRPTLLGFCDDAYSLLGVDIGARHVAAVVTDLRGQVSAFAEAPHAMPDDPHGTLKHVKELAARCLHEARIPKKSLVGVGVAVPSPVHEAQPGFISELFFPAWRGVDVQASLAKAYGVPVFVDNDANMGALAERFWGKGQDAEELIYVKVGAGVGAGLILRGELFRGSNGVSGEIGHIPIDPKGPLCVCGNRGCVTLYVGSDGLRKAAAEQLPKSAPHTVAEIERRARLGDAAALAVLDDVGAKLGSVVAGLLNLLNPKVVVLGGEITTLGELFLEPLRRSVKTRALPHVYASAELATSNLGPRAIALGAATMVLQKAFRDHGLFRAAANGGSGS